MSNSETTIPEYNVSRYAPLKRYKVTFVYSGLWLHSDHVYAESAMEAMDIIQASNPEAKIRDVYPA